MYPPRVPGKERRARIWLGKGMRSCRKLRVLDGTRVHMEEINANLTLAAERWRPWRLSE